MTKLCQLIHDIGYVIYILRTCKQIKTGVIDPSIKLYIKKKSTYAHNRTITTQLATNNDTTLGNIGRESKAYV